MNIKKIRKKDAGFTIVELLVVIAIIAILAGIVMVNVTSYIDRGKDAAAVGNLSTLLTVGAVWYDSSTGGNGTYDGFITGAGTGASSYVSVYNILVDVGYAVTATCNVADCAATSTNWCVQVTLKAVTDTFCVDSTGAKLKKAGGTCLVATGTCL